MNFQENLDYVDSVIHNTNADELTQEYQRLAKELQSSPNRMWEWYSGVRLKWWQRVYIWIYYKVKKRLNKILVLTGGKQFVKNI